MHLVALALFLAAAVVSAIQRGWVMVLLALGLAAWVSTAVPISVG
jgi:hypothetical protein